MPRLLEAQALVPLLAEFPEASTWISFSAGDGAHTCHGERLTDCAAALDACPQVAAIGVNCTAPQYIPALIDAIRAATNKPIVVYPNSGESYDATHHCWRGTSDSAVFAEQARGWAAHGARIIGGCCRTGPEHIRALAAWTRTPR